MKLGKSTVYIFFIAMLCIIRSFSSCNATHNNPNAIDKDEQRISSARISSTPDFVDLGDKFSFISERGERLTRNVRDYGVTNHVLYDLVSKKRAIIFGGAHLNDRQAFELSKKYAKEGKLDLMMNAGIHLHEGHTVINVDPETNPDYQADFTVSGFIKEVGLESQFEIASFENVKPSLTLCDDSLMNAWDSLIPGGRVLIYPAVQLFHETLLRNIGFSDIKFVASGYKDILVDRNLNFPACVAIKPL